MEHNLELNLECSRSLERNPDDSADNSWSPHIGRMINSAQRTAWVLSVLRDRSKLYRALLPCLEWSTKIEDTKAIESLQRTFFSKIVALNT